MVDVASVSEYAACPHPAACQFRYGWDVTPSVSMMSLAGAAGKQWKAYGTLVRAGARRRERHTRAAP